MKKKALNITVHWSSTMKNAFKFCRVLLAWNCFITSAKRKFHATQCSEPQESRANDTSTCVCVLWNAIVWHLSLCCILNVLLIAFPKMNVQCIDLWWWKVVLARMLLCSRISCMFRGCLHEFFNVKNNGYRVELEHFQAVILFMNFFHEKVWHL